MAVLSLFSVLYSLKARMAKYTQSITTSVNPMTGKSACVNPANVSSIPGSLMRNFESKEHVNHGKPSETVKIHACFVAV